MSGPLSRTRAWVGVRAPELRQFSPDAERHWWPRLRCRQLVGYKVCHQHPISRRFADFTCIEAGLAIAPGGGQHFLPEGLLADRPRSAGLAANGIKVLRFIDRETLMEREAVLVRVLDWSLTHTPQPGLLTHPSPSPACGKWGKPRSSPGAFGRGGKSQPSAAGAG